MKKEQVFTLIEILIVVSIIAVIAAIAAPNLLNARTTVNETSAKVDFTTIDLTQIAYTAYDDGTDDRMAYTDLVIRYSQIYTDFPKSVYDCTFIPVGGQYIIS